MANNPYYDESDGEGAGNSGSVDLSNYPTKAEVKDFDEVDLLSNDTKKVGTIYIDTDMSFWLWDATDNEYKPNPDMQTIPIVRYNKVENVAPSTVELYNIPIYDNSLAHIHLSNGIVEYWRYNNNIWSKLLRIEREPKVFTIHRDSKQEGVEPTQGEIDGFIAIDGDSVLLFLKEDNLNIFAIEKWVYSGGWTVKTIAYNTGEKSVKVSSSPFTPDTNNRENVFIFDCLTTGIFCFLPSVADSKDKIYTFKVDSIAPTNMLTIHPTNGETVNNSLDNIDFTHDGEYLKIMSDGTEWHIIDIYRVQKRDRVDRIIHRENPDRSVDPTLSEMNVDSLTEGDFATVILSDNNTMVGVEKWQYNGAIWIKRDDTYNFTGGYIDVVNLSGSIATISNPNNFYNVGTANVININTNNFNKGDIVTIRNDRNIVVEVFCDGTKLSDILPTVALEYIYDGQGGLSAPIWNKDDIKNYTYAKKFSNNAKMFGNTNDSFLYNGSGCQRVAGVGTGEWIKDTSLNSPMLASGDGINGRGLIGLSGHKNIIQNGGWGIARRSFLVSLWVKQTGGDYILGDTSSGGKDKALHFGWRDTSRFTLAFYANDVNWNSPTGKSRLSVMNVWTHYAVQYNYSNKTAKLWIDGKTAGSQTFPSSQASDASFKLEMLFGRIDLSSSLGIMSNLRLIRSGSGDILTDAQIENIYNIEKYALNA